MFYVLAGNHKQAKDWAEYSGLLPTEWRFVQDSRWLQGNRGGRLILVGTWFERREANELHDMAQALDMVITSGRY